MRESNTEIAMHEKRIIRVKRIDRYHYYIEIYPYYLSIGKGLVKTTLRKRVDIAELYDILKSYGIKKMKQLSDNEFEIETEY